MKSSLTLILLLFAVSLQAQVAVTELPANDQFTIAQVLASKDCNKNSKSTIKLVTEETSVQTHNGKETYKTVQEVEYLIKYKGTKISKKRNVLKTQSENLAPKGQAEQVFPDMTSNLLSSVLSTGTVKNEEESTMLPFTLTANDDGTVSLYLDKLAVMKAKGQETHIKGMGADLQFVQVSEKLNYKSSDKLLYIDALNSIESTYSVISKEKSGTTHKVEVKESIKIKDFIK